MLQSLDRFVTSKLSQNCSLQTVQWYEWLLRRYGEWCEHRALAPAEADTIEAFLADVRRKGQAMSTVDAYYRALRVYCNWLVQRRLMPADENPFAMLDQPKLPKKRPRHVTLDNFYRLYGSIDGTDWTSARDRTMLLILFYSGLRVGELLALREDDLQLGKGTIFVRGGKGGNDREVPCAPMLAAEFADYQALRPFANVLALWLSNDGIGGVRGPLTVEGVRQMLKRRCKAVGIPYLSPHKYRHGFAMVLLNAGMDMSALSAAMGHNSVVTTEQVYARWDTRGIQREYTEAMRRILRP